MKIYVENKPISCSDCLFCRVAYHNNYKCELSNRLLNDDLDDCGAENCPLKELSLAESNKQGEIL